uniref:Uncharacterized protein n=1 Tax=Timema monikensis TaxID=170555 RepID=A0A7R9EG38_9NEOP|nr:unnamed protein product [Timema monikensis]
MVQEYWNSVWEDKIESFCAQDRSVWCMTRNLMRVPTPRPPIVGRNGVANSNQEKTLYKKLLRPILDYACPTWGHLEETYMRRMQAFQRGDTLHRLPSKTTSESWRSPSTTYFLVPLILLSRGLGITSSTLEGAIDVPMLCLDKRDNFAERDNPSLKSETTRLNGCQLEDALYSIESEDAMHYLLVFSATCLLSAVHTPQGLDNVAAKMTLPIMYPTFNGSDCFSFQLTLSSMDPTFNGSDCFSFQLTLSSMDPTFNGSDGSLFQVALSVAYPSSSGGNNNSGSHKLTTTKTNTTDLPNYTDTICCWLEYTHERPIETHTPEQDDYPRYTEGCAYTKAQQRLRRTKDLLLERRNSSPVPKFRFHCSLDARRTFPSLFMFFGFPPSSSHCSAYCGLCCNRIK